MMSRFSMRRPEPTVRSRLREQGGDAINAIKSGKRLAADASLSQATLA